MDYWKNRRFLFRQQISKAADEVIAHVERIKGFICQFEDFAAGLLFIREQESASPNGIKRKHSEVFLAGHTGGMNSLLAGLLNQIFHCNSNIGFRAVCRETIFRW